MKNLFRNYIFHPNFDFQGLGGPWKNNIEFFFPKILLSRTTLKPLAEKNVTKLNPHGPCGSKCRTTLVTAPSPYLIYLIIIITGKFEFLSPLHQIATASRFSFYIQSLPTPTLVHHNMNHFFFSGAHQGGPEF